MSPGPQADVVLPADERSPAAARRHVRAVLEEAGRDDVLDVALLLTTELVTNSVLHAGTTTTVDVVPGPHSVTITVTDCAPGADSMVRPVTHAGGDGDADDALLREGGRGIPLLSALATRWGIVHTPTTKSVWFDLGASPAAGPSAGTRRRASTAPPRRDVSWLTRLPDAVERRLRVDELLGEIGTRLGEALGADASWVWVVAPDGEWRQVPGPGLGGPALGGTGFGTHGTGPGCDRRRLADGEPALATDLAAAPGPFPPSLARGGLRSALAVPIRLDATLLGCVELAAPRPGAFGEDDVALARLVAERMAVLIHSRRLCEAEQRRRGFLAFLAEASELLAGTFDTDHTLAMLVQLCVPRLATTAIVQLFDQHGQRRLVALADTDEARGARLRRTLTQRRGLTGLPAVGPSGDTLTVPLIARGRTLGDLCLVRLGPPSFAADDAALAEDLTRRAALAVDNARLYEEVAGTARALQRNLLPPGLPAADGVEFGASYAAAGEGNVVGGDFYDVVPLGDRRWALAVGDVCGKGADAAAVTGLARSAFRLLAPDDTRPDRTGLCEVLHRLNRLLLDQGDGGPFCTLAAAHVTVLPAALEVRMVSAGHPPPVLVPATGAARFAGALGTLVGVVDELDLPETRLTLEHGDSLVFYTDGLTERRDDAGVMFGEERLLRLLGTCARVPPQAMADALESEVRRFGRSPLRDDLAVLVVQAR